jgi:Leucine-rich repeat (LRR) protein
MGESTLQIPKKINAMKLLMLTALFICTSFAYGYRITDVSEIEGKEEEITEIDLSNKGLTEFPSEILSCKNLKWLDLSNNGFVKVPTSLGELKSLKHLDLSENQNLSQFDLMYIFDSCSFELKSLNLASSGLFFLPDGVALQGDLRSLDLSGNYLTVLPYSMMSMSKLRDVNLADNKLKNIAAIANYWWGLKRIDVSGNSGMNSEELLLSLCFIDGLGSVTISYLTVLPDEFMLFGADELIIKSSTIPKFPRSEYSPKIGRLIFEDCSFENPESTISAINSSQTTDYVGLREMVSVDLIPFLELKVDSIDIRSNVISDISVISAMTDVSWLDIRDNSISQQSLKTLAANKPGLEMVYQEVVQSSVGISPPVANYVQKPTVKKINPGKDQKISIGQASFDIPAQSFMLQNGQSYSGPVKLEYTEYTSPEQIFLSGISMTTDFEGETFMLSSGGMFNLEAKDKDDNTLALRPGKKIDVQFGATNNNQNMTTWQMDDNGVWQAKGENEAVEIFKIDQDLMDSIMNQDFYEISLAQIVRHRHRYMPNIGRGKRLEDFTISFDHLISRMPDEQVTFNGLNIEERIVDKRSQYLCQFTFVYDGEFSSKAKRILEEVNDNMDTKYRRLRIKGFENLYKKEGPNFIPELSLKPNHEKDNFTLTFSYMDTTFNLPVLVLDKKGNKAGAKKMVKFYKNYLEAHANYKLEREANADKIRPLIEKQKKAVMEKAKKDEEARQKRIWDLREVYRMEANASSVQRVLTIDGFGLWNCDRRSRMIRPTSFSQTFSSVAGGMIKEEPESITVIDRTTNGVITFKEKSRAFFDKMSDNVFIVFFTATTVGVYRNWKEKMNSDKIELKMFDVGSMSTGDFVKELQP